MAYIRKSLGYLPLGGVTGKVKPMQAATALRFASGASLLLFAGHTAGGLGSWSPMGNTAVLDAMRSFHFPVNGFTRSYWHFYFGFGLLISVYLLAQVVLLWQLASWTKIDPVRRRQVIAVFVAVAVLTTVLAWMFFTVPPLVVSLIVAVFLGLALGERSGTVQQTAA